MRSRLRRLVQNITRAGRGPTLVLTVAIWLIAGPASSAGAQAPDSEWQAKIDTTWGPGLPTERKLEIFDKFWTTIDERFASFQGIDVDWAARRDRYRPEVAGGVSRGRFAAIMGQLSYALQDLHANAFDLGVVQAPTPDPKPGVPVFIVGGGRLINNFGACATAQDDGSALIYAVAPGHPLGLQPGDRILGYDGRPWRELYHELLAAELPLRGNFASSPSAREHSLARSSIVNWHLFDTIDIVRHETGAVEHRSTAPLTTTPPLRSPFCSEQLPVPGVPKPAALTDVVTWGVIEGTRIGYIYGAAWDETAGIRFAQAVRELTQQRQTDGLIIDFRLNQGGNMWYSDAGLGMLFDRPVPTIGAAVRANPDDHLRLRPTVGSEMEGFFDFTDDQQPGVPPSYQVIDMLDRSYDRAAYDRPIAVLTGPGTASAGDHVALRMTFHPRARTFGKPTPGAFDFFSVLDLEPGWSARYAPVNTYLIDEPHDYLTHRDFPVDVPVWLRPDDVAQGKDAVVDAALHWINSQTQ
jgi:hypothetical protein